MSYQVAELLVNDDPHSRETGEQMLREHRDEILKSLTASLASESRDEVGTAAYELGLIISPWRRGKDASARFIQHTTLRCACRPVERVSTILEAKNLQQALLKAIHHMSAAAQANDRESYYYQEVINQLLSTLDEVADDGVIDQLLTEFKTIKSPWLAEGFVAVFDHYCGVPPMFRANAICGNSSKAEFDAFATEESRRLAEAKAAAHAVWAQLRTMSIDARIERAIAAWRSEIAPMLPHSPALYFDQSFASDKLAPLIRFGTPSIRLLREQQKREDDLGAKAIWECVIAAITGKEDKDLVRQLFAGSSDHQRLACELVEASGSQDWLNELSALQKRHGFDGGKASQVIAGQLRERGIPELELAVAFNKENFHARCSIDEIKARQKIGSPKRPGWFRIPW